MPEDKLKMWAWAFGLIAPLMIMLHYVVLIAEVGQLFILANIAIGAFVIAKYKGGMERIFPKSGLKDDESAWVFAKKGFYLFNTVFFWFIPGLNK